MPHVLLMDRRVLVKLIQWLDQEKYLDCIYWQHMIYLTWCSLGNMARDSNYGSAFLKFIVASCLTFWTEEIGKYKLRLSLTFQGKKGYKIWTYVCPSIRSSIFLWIQTLFVLSDSLTLWSTSCFMTLAARHQHW